MATRMRATAMYFIDVLALRAGNEKGEDECCGSGNEVKLEFDVLFAGKNEDVKRTDDIVMSAPYIDIDGVENTKERETPSYSGNDQALASGEELVDDRAEEQEVDERPEQSPLISVILASCSRDWTDQMRKAHGAGVKYVSLPV